MSRTVNPMVTRYIFFPDSPAAFTSLHLRVHLGSGGSAQLRLDAIDALETHYTPPAHGAKTMHQPLELTHVAGARLLDLLGFTDVVRDGETVVSATPDAVPGYILTRLADKYGSPVSLAYAGPTDQATWLRSSPMPACCMAASTTSCSPRDWPIPPSTASSTPTCARS